MPCKSRGKVRTQLYTDITKLPIILSFFIEYLVQHLTFGEEGRVTFIICHESIDTDSETNICSQYIYSQVL